MMPNEGYSDLVLALDHGTSGCKVALVSVKGKVIDFAYEATPIYFFPGGGAEQNPHEWWNAFTNAARTVLSRQKGSAENVKAICVSSTWSSTVAVDQNGQALMNSLTWMDSRGAPYVKKVVGGFPAVEGYSLAKLNKWLKLTAGIPMLSGKDDIAHMLLVKHEYPDIYEKTYKFLASKDYFNLRLTGEFAASYDSIMLFWVTDIRDIHNIRYDESLLKMLEIERDKLPELKSSMEVLGTLHAEAARELELSESVQVFMGSPDHQSALVGSGAVRDYEGHCYIGTSSWVECLVPFKKSDILRSIASLPSSIPGRYQCINEQDIAGGALSFLQDNILAPIQKICRTEAAENPYQVLDNLASSVPAGANKVIFTPWLNGERTPVDSTTLRGGIYNLSMSSNIHDIVRATFEGVAYNTRWSLGYVEKFIKKPFSEISLIGGGAKSDVWCQIFADVLNRPIKQIADPQMANARGAAFIAAVGLGKITVDDIPALVESKNTYQPNPQNKEIYDQLYGVFLSIYKNNKGMFAKLNAITGSA